MKLDTGFTLVEILVSLSIVALMLGVGLPAFREYGRTAELVQAGTDMQAALLQAHTLALAPEVDKPSSENYYGVRFDDAADSFDVIRGVQDTLGTSCPASPTQIQHHTLPTGISIAPPAPVFCVGYLIGTGAVPSLAGLGNATIAVTSSRVNGVTINVRINKVTGQVTVE